MASDDGEPTGERNRASHQLQVTFGRNCRQLRTDAGLSQTALGRLVGMTQSRVGLIERAEGNLTLETMTRIAIVLGTTVKNLLTSEPSQGLLGHESKGQSQRSSYFEEWL